MSLPVIRSITESADLEKTVLPYVSQLVDLPNQVFQSIGNFQALKSLYLSTNPLISAFALSLIFSPIFFVASEINKNYSQVDRFWSLLPTFYNAHFVLYVHALGLPTARLDALLAASALWSTRLTFNYWRKGGYKIGSEDYRWEILRQYINPTLFCAFNISFISLAQNNRLESGDFAFSCAIVAFIALSFVADQQQWDFQNAKHEYQKTAKYPKQYHREDLDRGFNVVGLWSLSRHPNFAAEQGVWLTLYAWSCYVTKTYYNWTSIGAGAYLVLFQASTWFTETVSAKKYPEYKEYQKRVGKFIPSLNSRWQSDYSDQRRSKVADKQE
ncbi:MAG: hypothetical protein Q9191_003435 [Dirinaria sp. TL-2023a]